MLAARWRRFKQLQAFLTLARDPERTDAVFKMADNVPEDSPARRHVVARAMAIPELGALIKARYTPPKIDLEALKLLPEGSFGRVFADHMIANGLDPNFYPMPRSQDELAYLALRARQTHDFWHVLTGYSTEYLDEVALQSFTLAQLEAPTSALIIAAGFLYLLSHGPERIPDFMSGLIDGWNRGRRARCLLGVKWEERFAEPLEALKREMNLASLAEERQ